MVPTDTIKAEQPLDANQQLANRYYLSFKDMQDAERYVRACLDLRALRKDGGSPNAYVDHCEGLLHAAIVAYCRPFKESSSKGFANACLGIKHLKYLKTRKDLHKLLLQKRDQIIAHSDWEQRKTAVFQIDDQQTVIRIEPIPYIDNIDLDVFLELIVAVGAECRKQTYLLDTGEIKAQGGG